MVRRVDHIDILVGKNIRKHRKFLGLSQTNIAEILGITFQQVQKYESGTNRLSASKLYLISQALGVSISDLYMGIDSADTPDSSVNLLSDLSEEALEMLHMFQKIKDPNVRSAIEGFIRNVSKK